MTLQERLASLRNQERQASLNLAAIQGAIQTVEDQIREFEEKKNPGKRVSSKPPRKKANAKK